MPSAADVELRDGDLLVRAWRDGDDDAVGVTPRDPEVGRFFGAPLRSPRDPDAHAPTFAIVENGRSVGRIWFAPQQRPFEVDYLLRPDARGRGLATRALRLVVAWMAEQGEPTVVLYTHPANERSLRVAERAGFRRDGAEDQYAAFKDGTTRVLRFVHP